VEALHESSGDAFDVQVRILDARAIEPRRWKCVETVIGWIEVGMLAGQDQIRAYASRRQRSRNRGKLDRFGSGADDQPNVCGMQLSP
jgi:hypothetical protein